MSTKRKHDQSSQWHGDQSTTIAPPPPLPSKRPATSRQLPPPTLCTPLSLASNNEDEGRSSSHHRSTSASNFLPQQTISSTTNALRAVNTVLESGANNPHSALRPNGNESNSFTRSTTNNVNIYLPAHLVAAERGKLSPSSSTAQSSGILINPECPPNQTCQILIQRNGKKVPCGYEVVCHKTHEVQRGREHQCHGCTRTFMAKKVKEGDQQLLDMIKSVAESWNMDIVLTQPFDSQSDTCKMAVYACAYCGFSSTLLSDQITGFFASSPDYDESKRKNLRKRIERVLKPIMKYQAEERLLSFEQYIMNKNRLAAERAAEKIRLAAERAEKNRLAEERAAEKKAELLEHQQKLLQVFNDEEDDQKKCNLKVGLDYFDSLLTMRNEETGDEETKQLVNWNWLRTECTELLQITEGNTMFQNKYLGNLERRKKERGHSGSEAYRKRFQHLKKVKKAFDEELKLLHHKEIDEEFCGNPKLAEQFKKDLRAVADGCFVDTHGKGGGSTKEEAAAIAAAKVREMLTLLANHSDISVDDILPPGMTLKQFLDIDRKDEEAMNRLRRLAMEEAEKKGTKEIEQIDIQRFGELSFLTCQQILIYHDDIVNSVMQKKVRAIQHPTSSKWLFFACIPNELILQFCIGSIYSEGLDLEDFEREIHIKGKYVIQLFGGDEYIRLYRVTENSIKRVNFHVTTTDNLFKFVCSTQRDKSFESEKKYASEKKWSLHRLEQVVLFNLGLGMNRCEWFRYYFGLKGNETFEEKLSYYEYDPDAAKKRRARLKLKGWENVSQAVQCDIDHLIGRMHMWMNASIFGMPCSHSWNQCMGKVRQQMGCWGFAFATIKYNGGN